MLTITKGQTLKHVLLIMAVLFNINCRAHLLYFHGWTSDQSLQDKHIADFVKLLP